MATLFRTLIDSFRLPRRRTALQRTGLPRKHRRSVVVQPLECRRVLDASVSIAIESPPTVAEDPREELVYTLTRDETDDHLVVPFQIGGSATFDQDYLLREAERDTVFLPENPVINAPIVGTANFFPGESEVQILVSPKSDSVFERNETVSISLEPSVEYGQIVGATAKIRRNEATEYFVVDNENRLARVDVETGIVHVIGELDIANETTDIAITESGQFYAITADQLFEVDLEQIDSGLIAARLMGPHGIQGANALVAAQDDDFGSGDGDLFAVGMAALDLQLIDIETVDDEAFMQSVTTVFDIDAALRSEGMQDNFFSTGDLDYVSAGHIILAARGFNDAFDSLIEIQTPSNRGEINRAPIPAMDPGRPISDVRGLAFDGNDSYAFSGLSLLDFNQFSRDTSDNKELTGRTYQLATESIATGIIEGEPVDPPVVFINRNAVDPDDLSKGPQPTNWLTQRSQIHDIEIELGAPIDSLPNQGIVLTHLGLVDDDPDTEIVLQPDQIELGTNGDALTITPDPGQLPDGRYSLSLSAEITSGPEFHYSGDAQNRFYVLAGDWDGNNRVDLLDLDTLAYWFASIDGAPDYVNLDGSGGIAIADFDPFEANFGSSVELPDFSIAPDPELVDEATLTHAKNSLIQPADVNGSEVVTPIDALIVINRLARQSGGILDWKYDANRDGNVTPRDALFVINVLAASISQSPPPPAGFDRLLSESLANDDGLNLSPPSRLLKIGITPT